MLPASSTSRPTLPVHLTVLAAAAKWLLVLLLSGWGLLGLGWALLHGWIVPRIGEFRPQLQTLASQATGLRVEIGELSARSTGVFPSFELRDVRLLDDQGRPALLLPQVLVALSPRSVMTLSLEQLVIRGAELDMRRTADGQLFLAGLPLASPQNDNPALADWLFSQAEWALLDGTLRWTDEQHQVALTLRQVDAVMRNPGHKHLLRLDATPPPEWGERFSLRGQFRQPLLLGSAGQWRRWSGELYGEFSRIDAAPFKAYASLAGVTLGQGQGALRAWLDVDKGSIVGATADVQLQDAQARLAPQLQPLAFKQVTGRFAWLAKDERGLNFQTESLSFETADGLRWPGGNVALNLSLNEQGEPTRGSLKADKLDLAALAAISERLPLAESWRQQLQQFGPGGLVEQLEASWQGPLAQPAQLSLKGRASDLLVAAEDGPRASRPGAGGLSLDFKLEREGGQDKGQASFSLNKGWLEFPGIFQEPRLPLDKLSGELRFKRDASGLEVEVKQGTLVAADAQGQFQGSWKRGPKDDALGRLDLQGQLSRGDGARVWRYLPQAIPESVRKYVQQAVQQGQLSDVRFKVKGPLASFPFDRSRDGDFQVTGKLRNASYSYVPGYLLEPGSKPWPGLAQLEAELVFDRGSLQINKAQARVAGFEGLSLGKAQARIADLINKPVVEVGGEFKGPLAQALNLVNQSPVAAMTQQALAATRGSGAADYRLQLSLPLKDLARSRVQGSVNLPGNEVQFTPDAPLMSRLRGTVNFSESGFQITNAQARMLGGDLRFEGGTRASRRPDEPEVLFRGQGTVTADGLQQARELPWLPGLAARASGSTAYTATLGFRQGFMELGVSSSLSGLALALPEPLNKPAAAALPVRFEKAVLRESLAPGRRAQDRLSLSVGPGAGLARPAQATYVRDISGPQPQVLRGQLHLGTERVEADAGDREVRAQVQLASFDADAWEQVLGRMLPEGATGASAGMGYLPTVYNLRAASFKSQGHTLQQLVLGGKREGGTWRANIDATELSGYGEYRQPSGNTPARLFARLSRLSLGPGSDSEVEALLDNQPSSIPTLDIVVDDLELRGKKLGRLEVEAVNRNLAGREANREWRLAKLNLSMPEASFSATGSWAPLATGGGTSARAGTVRRGTSMNFRLDVNDSGLLLKRLGMDGAIRRGKGRLEGNIAWTGSPMSLHYPSMNGQLLVDIESGQFLKAEPGVAKLLGVLNLQALPRRLTLDFRDVFSEGFAFDWVRGDVAIRQGVASTSNLRMKGVNAAVLMEGSADIAHETQDLRVVVVPELNAGTASLLASAVNPAVAVGTFVAQWLLRQPLNDAATQEFHLSGTWKDPQIQRVPRQKSSAGTRATPEAKP